MANNTTTILVIDDDPQICFALESLFALQGWKTYCAESVKSGVERLKISVPDIVLIDYHMPRTNGVEGVRIIRGLNETVPVIVFTIDESQEVADDFLRAGANDFAIKPIKAPDIISRIKLHLRLIDRDRKTEDVRPEKGISANTLELIEEYLREHEEYATVNEIARGTGLAYQTVYRYIQYLTKIEHVEMLNSYGKVGRPKQFYRKKR